VLFLQFFCTFVRRKSQQISTGRASSTLAGAVREGRFFGWLTDRLGRESSSLLNSITLALYLLATAPQRKSLESISKSIQATS
jgi:hypothetical protein